METDNPTPLSAVATAVEEGEPLPFLPNESLTSSVPVSSNSSSSTSSSSLAALLFRLPPSRSVFSSEIGTWSMQHYQPDYNEEDYDNDDDYIEENEDENTNEEPDNDEYDSGGLVVNKGKYLQRKNRTRKKWKLGLCS